MVTRLVRQRVMSENSSNGGGAAPSTAPTPPARPPPPLCPLLQDGEDYDAWVLAGGRLFRAHGSVLASHSAYLRAAVGGEREARLLLPHVPPAGFAAILAYMYTGRLPLTPATLYEASPVSCCNAIARRFQARLLVP